MPSRRLKTPTQVSVPSTSRMLTRSQAKKLASMEPSTKATSSTGLAQPSREPSVRKSRARKTGGPPVQNALTPSKSETNRRAHGRSSSSKGGEQSARKRRRPIRESSASSVGEMKNAAGINDRRSYNSGGRQSRSTRPQSPTITSSRRKTDVFRTKRQSTARAKQSEKRRIEDYGTSKSKRRSLYFDLDEIESHVSPLLGKTQSTVRWCVRTSTPVSHGEKTPQTRTHRETTEDSTGRKAKLHRTPSGSATTPRSPERASRKYKGCRRRILTEPNSDNEISTSTKSTVSEGKPTSPAIESSQASGFRCVLM
ncbi:uncharacterized protein LOC125940939 [Dermacentor silvarum]|uniref:uncharacterized protein LOC125940939 n=1 Tax=Dermacentor silvarum TaxID=543639 RepID=UPI002100CC0E|nr:uncharacterized protein LOC125940939 [Dermacentor silvarum]